VGVGSATFAGVGIVAVCLVSTGPAALAQRSLSPGWGYIDNRTVSPDGEHIVLTVQHYPLSQVWAMPTDGGEMYRLSRRSPAAMNPVFSPDGEWVAYFTEHYGAVGLRYRDPDLWLARADGSSTRLLASDLPRSGPTGPNLQAIFTADSTHVAVLRSMHLCLVATSDGRSRCADLQADLQGRTSPRLIDTSSSGDEIFLVVRGPAMEYRVVGVAAEIGALRTVASLRSVSSPMWLGSVRGETDDYLVALRTGEGRGATSINTSTGETRDVAVCHSGLGIADALYYVACEGPRAGFLVRHDVSTGAEAPIAAIDPDNPAYGTIVPDATGQRIALVTESTESGGAPRVFRRGGGTVRVFDRDGTELLSSWWPSEPRVVAWTRDDRLIVAQGMNVRPDRSISWRLTGMLQVIDVRTGTSDPIELGWPR
jgi:hypothetical protein